MGTAQLFRLLGFLYFLTYHSSALKQMFHVFPPRPLLSVRCSTCADRRAANTRSRAPTEQSSTSRLTLGYRDEVERRQPMVFMSPSAMGHPKLLELFIFHYKCNGVSVKYSVYLFVLQDWCNRVWKVLYWLSNIHWVVYCALHLSRGIKHKRTLCLGNFIISFSDWFTFFIFYEIELVEIIHH